MPRGVLEYTHVAFWDCGSEEKFQSEIKKLETQGWKKLGPLAFSKGGTRVSKTGVETKMSEGYVQLFVRRRDA